MHWLAYYVHDLRPSIVEWGFIKPRWYGFAYLMGFLVAYLLLRKLSRKGMLRLHPDRVPDMVLNCCIFGVLVGGRLGYVLFYNLPISLSHGETPMLWDFSGSLPFWGVLKVWEGGMSAHGGILFTIIALAWFARKYKASLVNIGDAACMVVPVGLCFGRIANFINGELYGHPTTVPWGVKFPSEVHAPTNGVLEPAVKMRLPEVMQQVIGPGDWFSPGGFSEGLDLLSKKLVMHQHDAVQAVAAVLPARHASQLYEALLEGVALFLICWCVGWFWRKDGMAGGAFLTFYPIMRIIGEQFRVGDTPVSIAGMEISKGVLYSAPLVVVGLVYWGYWIKKDQRIPWVAFQAAATSDVSGNVPAERSAT